MILPRSLSLAVVVALLLCPAVFGQHADQTGADDVRYWAYAGPALTTLGMGGSGGLAVEFGGNVLSARAASTHPTFGRETWEVALLYGRAARWQGLLFSGGVGVSVVGGTSYSSLFGGGTGSPFEPMIGFPLEGKVSWAPTGFLALGLQSFANVNTAHPFGGLGVHIRLGQVR